MSDESNDFIQREAGIGVITQDVLVTCILMAIIGLVGVIGNGLMLRAYIKYIKLRTNFYTVFCSLSIADTVFLLVAVPSHIRYATIDRDSEPAADTEAEKIWCKASHYIMDACGFISAYLLVVLAVLRAILLTNRNTNSQPKPFHLVILSVVIYCIAFVSSIPIINTVDVYSHACFHAFEHRPDAWRRDVWLKGLFSLFFPLGLVLTVHSVAHKLGKRYFSDSYSPREKEKSRLVIAIIAAFAICQFPYRVESIYLAYFKLDFEPETMETWDRLQILKNYLLCLMAVDKAVRPILYSKLASDLCEAFDEVINCTYCSRVYYQDPLNDRVVGGLIAANDSIEPLDERIAGSAEDCESPQANVEVHHRGTGTIASLIDDFKVEKLDEDNSGDSRISVVESLGRTCDRLISTSSSESATSQTPLVSQREEVEMLPEAV